MRSLTTIGRTMVVSMAMAATALVAAADAKDQVRFGDHTALTAITSAVGVEKGFFAEEGIELIRTYSQRSTEVIQAAIAGSVDFSYAANAPFIAATASGAPIVAVGLLSHGYSGILLTSKENSGISSLEELRGKRIGMQRGTGVATVFLITLEQLGLEESDFEITNLRVADMPTAMQGGGFDAVLGWEPGMSRIVDMGYGDVAMTAEQFEEIAGITYTFPLFTTRQMVETNPDLVQRFLNAWAKSQQFLHENRPEALAILRETMVDAVSGTSDDELELLTYMYRQDRTAFSEADLLDLERTQDFMYRQGQLAAKVPIEELLINDFALKAEEAFRQ